MKESHKLCLGILMIVIGSLAVEYNLWKRWIRDNEYEQETTEDFYLSSVFEVYKRDEYTCVNITSLNITVYESLSSSEAIQWAIDNVLNMTRIDIMEDIVMDGNIDLFSTPNKSYSMFAKGGYLVYDYDS